MSSIPASDFKPRLFVLPWGLYPRRITIYLKEKQIASEFEIVRIETTPTGLAPCPGKPPGTVPILEAQPGVFIKQSSAILEYLEDKYAQEPSLRGSNLIAAARCREMMDLANEITTVASSYVHQASALFARLEKQSISAAEAMLARLQLLLGQMQDVADEAGPFLVPGSGTMPMLADCVMLSTWQFLDHVYGVDIFKGYERLGRFLKAMLERPSAEMQYAPDFILQLSRQMSVLPSAG